MLSQSFWRRFIKMLMVLAVVIVVVLAVLFYCAWIDFKEYYLGVMRNLNSSETKAFMRSRISGTYDFIELIEWTNDNLNWCDESFTRYSDPRLILEQGKGRCEEFAIVYVAACLACGYEARIVVSRQFYQIFIRGFHAWAEVKVNGTWVQVDPSPTPFWNDTSRYRSWNWGPRCTLKVYAFEDGKVEDVTWRYR